MKVWQAAVLFIFATEATKVSGQCATDETLLTVTINFEDSMETNTYLSVRSPRRADNPALFKEDGPFGFFSEEFQQGQPIELCIPNDECQILTLRRRRGRDDEIGLLRAALRGEK